MKLMQRYRTSLTFRILVLTCTVSGAVFLGLFLATSHWQKKGTLNEVKSGAARLSQMIGMIVDDPMRRGDTEGTEAAFHELAKQHKGIDVFMTDFEGNVTYSTRKDDERKPIAQVLKHEDCTQMVLRALKQKGGRALAQSDASCVVYGMPKAIVDAGLSDEIVDIDDMAQAIMNNLYV